MLTRRQFLEASALVGVGLLVPRVEPKIKRPAVPLMPPPLDPDTLTRFTEQLPAIPVVDARAGGTFDMVMVPGLHQFHSALPPTPTWGYGVSGTALPYLGPTFEAKRGVPIEVNALNDLGPHPVAASIDVTLHGAVEADRTTPRTSVHLHGGNTEPQSDGFPEDTFLPGQFHQFMGVDYPYHYNNNQQAGNLFYHDHALGITRLNVYAGLAGAYLLRDDWDTGQPGNGAGLPPRPYERVLLIQDKSFNADGTLFYDTVGALPSAHPQWTPEFFGNVAVVNGKVWPNLSVDRGVYRFRIINGSGSRFYNLRLQGGARWYQIGTDTGLLNAPVKLGSLLIAPGERVDVLVDFSKQPRGATIVMTNDAPTPFPSGKRRNIKKGAVPLPEIMQFTVGAAPGFPGPIPTTLLPTPIPTLPPPTRVRNLALVEILDPATGIPVVLLLNNLFWAEEARIETPTVDTVEQWNIINVTADTHPIHLHLVQFQVLGRQKFDVGGYLAALNAFLPAPGLPDPAVEGLGPWPAPSADAFSRGPLRPPDHNEKGWKDTVRSNPGEITRILVPFGGAVPGAPYTNSFTGEYVWHCHILEHEDNEMMVRYRVVP